MAWTPDQLTARDRVYGVRSRVRRFRWELTTGGLPLVRWFPRSWFTDPLALVDICSPWEAAWVTRNLARDAPPGAIVELGPWLGTITSGILRGLKRRAGGDTRVIDAYDLFTFDDIERRTAGLPFEGRLRDGDDFLDLYLDRLGPDAPRVRPHKGDILDQTWEPDAPIGFLFNDIAKSWTIWNHVTSTFYRGLRARSTLVEQDWAHACTPWIHLWHYRQRPFLEPIGQVPNAGSVAFKLKEELPPVAFEPTGMGDYGSDEIDEAFDWAASLVDPSRQPNVRAARVQLHTLHGSLDVASRICVQELARSHADSELLSIALPVLDARLRDEPPGPQSP